MSSRSRKLCASLFALSLVAGCSSSDSPPPTELEKSETAASVGTFGVDGIDAVLGFDVPALPDSSSEATLDDGATRLVPLRNLRALFGRYLDSGGENEATLGTTPCGTAGNVTITCEPEGEGVRITLTANGCVESLAGFDVSINGAVEYFVDDPEACGNLDDIDDSRVELTFSSFTTTIRSEGQTVASIEIDGDLTIDRSELTGCTAESGSVFADFSMRLVSQQENIDIVVTAEDLSLDLAATESPCQETLTADGVLRLEDRVEGRDLRQTFDDFVVVREYDSETTVVRISGSASTSCFGVVTFQTVEDIVLPDDGDCPVSGSLLLTLPEVGETGTTAAVDFRVDGSVEIDLGDDGDVEVTRSSCEELEPLNGCGA